MCCGDAAFLSNYFDHLLIFKNMLLSVGLFLFFKGQFYRFAWNFDTVLLRFHFLKAYC